VQAGSLFPLHLVEQLIDENPHPASADLDMHCGKTQVNADACRITIQLRQVEIMLF